jgi:hypothetical protein
MCPEEAVVRQLKRRYFDNFFETIVQVGIKDTYFLLFVATNLMSFSGKIASKKWFAIPTWLEYCRPGWYELGRLPLRRYQFETQAS